MTNLIYTEIGEEWEKRIQYDCISVYIIARGFNGVLTLMKRTEGIVVHNYGVTTRSNGHTIVSVKKYLIFNGKEQKKDTKKRNNIIPYITLQTGIYM